MVFETRPPRNHHETTLPCKARGAFVTWNDAESRVRGLGIRGPGEASDPRTGTHGASWARVGRKPALPERKCAIFDLRKRPINHGHPISTARTGVSYVDPHTRYPALIRPPFDLGRVRLGPVYRHARLLERAVRGDRGISSRPILFTVCALAALACGASRSSRRRTTSQRSSALLTSANCLAWKLQQSF